MKEIEKNALNDVLRTIILINGKIEEIAEIQKQQEILISYLRGMIAGSESEWFYLEIVGQMTDSQFVVFLN